LDSTNSGWKFRVGGGCLEKFYFSGKVEGKSMVYLTEHQAWEKNIPPDSAVILNFIVR